MALMTAPQDESCVRSAVTVRDDIETLLETGALRVDDRACPRSRRAPPTGS
jgi:hypothetical protein